MSFKMHKMAKETINRYRYTAKYHRVDPIEPGH